MTELTLQQKQFFETFGYLVFPGLLREDIGWITDEFEAVFPQWGATHDGATRTCIVPFIDQRERLCTLLDHPAIKMIASGILGKDFNYAAGDGNYYTGDTAWHSDGHHRVGKYLKIALYLDPVARETGCLRVIPGTHRLEMENWPARQATNANELWGIEGRDVPHVALESSPGDVVAFNHNLMHASFGGTTRRRMFTMNLCAHCQTSEEVEELRTYIGFHSSFLIDHMHSDVMKQTASSERIKHLQQVMENEDHLPALSAQRREVNGARRAGQYPDGG